MSTVLLILFIIWGIPLTAFRSRFRKMVYQTDSWWINIEPRFTLELKGLFGNIFPNDPEYIRVRNFYRFYLVVYLLLFTAWKLTGGSLF